jgi:archaellum component FlaC
MTTKLDDISEAIGSLRAEMAGLRRDFQTSESRANSHRTGVHRRMDDLVSELSGVKVDLAIVKGDVTDVKDDIADMKPVTDDVKRWKLMGIGALGVTGIAAAAIASIVTAYWSKIVRVIVGS